MAQEGRQGWEVLMVPLRAGIAALAGCLIAALIGGRVEGAYALATMRAFSLEAGRNHGYLLVQLFNTDSSQNPAGKLSDLRKSAEQGDSNAQYMLGLAYDVGVGAAQDFAEAATWYRKAADQGHAGAQFNLGHVYADGRGVKQDYVQAHMWLNLAAAGSQPGARSERDLVAKKMTRSQLTEALRLAREWQAKTGPAPETNVSSPSEPSSSPEDRNRPP